MPLQVFFIYINCVLAPPTVAGGHMQPQADIRWVSSSEVVVGDSLGFSLVISCRLSHLFHFIHFFSTSYCGWWSKDTLGLTVTVAIGDCVVDLRPHVLDIDSCWNNIVDV